MKLHDIILRKPHVLPITTGIFFPLSCILCYSLAIYFEHVEFVITFISDTVIKQPLQGIFGLCVTLTMMAVPIICYIRHLYIEEIFRIRPEIVTIRSLKANSSSAWIMTVGVFSMLCVAQFQMNSAVFLHALSAFIGIGCGLAYFILQTICSRTMVPKYTSKLIYNFRFSLCIINVTLYVVAIITAVIAFRQFDGKERHVWNTYNKGYDIHAVSSVCEWLMLASYASFLITFSHEFKHIQLQTAQVILKSEVPDFEQKVAVV